MVIDKKYDKYLTGLSKTTLAFIDTVNKDRYLKKYYPIDRYLNDVNYISVLIARSDLNYREKSYKLAQFLTEYKSELSTNFIIKISNAITEMENNYKNFIDTSNNIDYKFGIDFNTLDFDKFYAKNPTIVCLFDSFDETIKNIKDDMYRDDYFCITKYIVKKEYESFSTEPKAYYVSYKPIGSLIYHNDDVYKMINVNNEFLNALADTKIPNYDMAGWISSITDISTCWKDEDVATEDNFQNQSVEIKGQKFYLTDTKFLGYSERVFIHRQYYYHNDADLLGVYPEELELINFDKDPKVIKDRIKIYKKRKYHLNFNRNTQRA